MKRFLYIALIVPLCLASCGSKKSLSYGQPAAANVFYPNTFHLDAACSEQVKHYAGNYILDHQNNIHGQKMPEDSVTADRLVLTDNGYYYKYKNDSLVDYGRFNVRNHARFKICVEQYKLDAAKGELTDKIERIEKEIGDPAEVLTDWYSYTRDYHCLWTARRYNNNSNKWELEFIVDIHNDCLRYQWPGSNKIKWVQKP